jgi:hypothetical protein
MCRCKRHLPRFPIYIPSKSRATNALTPHYLDRMGVPYKIIVEHQQLADYQHHYSDDRLLVLDPAFQHDYDTCDDDPNPLLSKGPGPARNFAWHHALEQGHTHHWVMDDNIRSFMLLQNNRRGPTYDPGYFHAQETFMLRYTNVGMAGPHYKMFAPSTSKLPPFLTNTRIFSCNLIRNDLPQRWRGRYNEDLILSLDILKAGWCTIQFYAFLQDKVATQVMAGGNTDEFYSVEGTLRKSVLANMVHPDLVRVVRRYKAGEYHDELGRTQQGRWHHVADFSPFADMGLLRHNPPAPDTDHTYQWGLAPNPHYRTRLRDNTTLDD